MATEAINIILSLVDNFSKGIDKITSKVDSFQSKASNIAAAFTPVSLAAGAALGLSVKTAIDFEKAMNGAARALDLNANQLKDFDKEVSKIQKNLGFQFSKTAIANIAADAGKLGIAAKDVGAFAETIGKLGVATDQTKNMEKLSSDSANVMNIFKMSIPQFNSYAGALNMLDDRFATTSLKLTEFMKISGGLANISKMTSNNLLGWGAAFTDAGFKAGAAGTAMNKFMQLGAGALGATKKQNAALETIGLSAEKFAKMYMTDANGALLEMFTRLKALEPMTRGQAMGNLFGQEHIDAANIILGQLDKLKQAQALANNETANSIKLNQEFFKQQNTVAGQMEAFKNTLDTIGVSLGKSLLPGIMSVMNAITPLLLKLEEMTAKHPEISTMIVSALGIVAIIAPLAAITSAIAGILPILGAIGGAIATVVGVAVSAPALFVAACAAIGAAVGALAYLIYANWDKIKKTVDNAFESSILAGRRFFDWLTKGTIANMQAFANWGNGIVNTIGNAFTQAAQPVVRFINWLESSMNGLGERAYKWGAGLLQGFINGLQSMYSNVQNAMNNFTGWLRQYLPSSDAKRGGLSDLTYSGQMFAQTFMKGIEAGGLYDALNGLTTPRISGNATRLTPASTASSQLNYAPVYNITARDSNDIIKQIKQRDKELLDLINRSSSRVNRTAY